MISPRPFQAHQFALLHLLGLLSITRPQDHANPDKVAEAPAAGVLTLPQEVIINAMCYLTEQIHEVARPPLRLLDMVADVYHLSSTLSPSPPPAHQDTSSPNLSKKKRSRTSTRTPSKRASTSPAASTRPLRRSTSRATLGGPTALLDTPSVTPPPSHISASTPIVEADDMHATFLLDGEEPDRTRASFVLADRLYTNVLADIKRMQESRSDALFASLLEFRVLLGDLENPNSAAFLDRLSPLGMWLRRASLNLNTMLFAETEQLIDDLLTWGGLVESSKRNLEDQALFSVANTVPPESNTLQDRTETFEAYRESMRKEDYSRSLDFMQRFFDYETSPLAGGSSANRGMRQHALLNLAQFHLINEEYPAARIAATEGMKIARHTSDLVALNALATVMKKITFEDSSERQEYRDGGHGDVVAQEQATREDPGGYVPPMEHLWDIRFGLSTRVPLPSLIYDLLRAKALSYFAANQKLNLSSKERRKEKKLAAQQGKDALNASADAQQKRLRWNRLDTVAWTAVTADLWERMGSSELARFYQVMGTVVKAGDIDHTSGATIALLCQRAEKLAKQGLFDHAVAMLLTHLLKPDSSELSLRDVQTWQRTVYYVLRLQAERSGNELLVSEIDRVCPPAPLATGFTRRQSSPCDASILGFPVVDAEVDVYSGLIGEVESLLQRADKFMSIAQSAHALPLAVRASSLTSLQDGQGLVTLHRRATLMLVRVQVAFGTCDRALRLLNEVWSDILGSQDDELLAYANEVRADTLTALIAQVVEEREEAGDEGREALAEAVQCLHRAAELHEHLGSPPKRIDILMKLAMLHHHHDDAPSRDAVAKECRGISIQWENSRSEVYRDQLERFSHIQKICVQISAAVAVS